MRWIYPPAFAAAVVLSFSGALAAQAPTPPPLAEDAPEPVIERVDGRVVRVGAIQVDQEGGRVSLDGVVNPATVLEYLATARDGFKSYESALELEASPEEFNLAMIFIGLDSEKAVPSRYKFDPELPQGDSVDIWVEWQPTEGETRRVRAEELIYDESDASTMTTGPWVYTGSVFGEDGSYLATVNGVLLGFMHTPESIIDSPRPLGSSYGSHRLNPDLGLLPGMSLTVVIEKESPEGAQ